ncbi:MAG: AMP-dependent synthetase/ligase [Nocardioides sp.]
MAITPPEAPLETLVERERIEQQIAGRTLVTALAATVEQYGAEPAYSDRNAPAGWRTITWSDLRAQALDIAAALIGLGVEHGDRVMIMAASRIEHVLTDLGAMHAGAIPISVYATLSPAQVAWNARHATPAVVVLEGADQLARWSEALADPEITAGLKAVVVIDAAAAGPHITWARLVADGTIARAADPSAVTARIASITPDDAATILYTSGTTGDPKAVVLTHHNVLFEVHSSTGAAGLTGPAITLSYLPLAHIAERLLGIYVALVQSAHVHFIADPTQLPAALGEVRPTRFFGVPRVWEKIMTGVSARLAAEPDADRKAAIAAAMEIGRAYVASLQTGERTPAELAERFAAADAAVLGPMRALLGLDRCEWATSAAAPMPPEVAAFFAGLGLQILDVYGMTETTASVAALTPTSYRQGTVGRALPGIELRIGEDGEILARGPIATPGYYRNEAATASLKDADGWVRTGDIGTLDEDGFLRVVDRKKELIINSSGKNIAPSVIENYLKESPLVGHAMVIGDARPYLVALLTLDGEIAPVIARSMGIEETGLEVLARDPRIRAAVQQTVDAANARLSRPEQVKRFELLPVEWTAESAELTPTLKLKRRVVVDRYAAAIEGLYATEG